MSIETDRLARLAGLHPGAGASSSKIPLAPAYVYLLAEHLDTILAAGEDLLASEIVWNAGNPFDADAARRDRDATRRDVAAIRTHEMSLIAHALRARDHAANLANRETAFGPLARLFAASTSILADAAAELAGTPEHQVKTGDAVMHYLRSRGLVARDAAAPMDGASLHVDEEFRVARRVPLGALLDLAAHFLDALEANYDLFVDTDTPAPRKGQRETRPVPAASTALPQSVERSEEAGLSLAAAIAAVSAMSAGDPLHSQAEDVQDRDARGDRETKSSLNPFALFSSPAKAAPEIAEHEPRESETPAAAATDETHDGQQEPHPSADAAVAEAAPSEPGAVAAETDAQTAGTDVHAEGHSAGDRSAEDTGTGATPSEIGTSVSDVVARPEPDQPESAADAAPDDRSAAEPEARAAPPSEVEGQERQEDPAAEPPRS